MSAPPLPAGYAYPAQYMQQQPAQLSGQHNPNGQYPQQYPQNNAQQYPQQNAQQYPQQYPQQNAQQYPQQNAQQYPQQNAQQYPQQNAQQYPQQYPPQYPQPYSQQSNQQYPPQYPQQGNPQQGVPMGYPPPAPQAAFNRHQPHQASGATNPGWYRPPPGGGKEMRQMHENFQNQWETAMLLACCQQPLCCVFAAACPWCAVFTQRKKLLMVDKDEANWKYYECCAGIWGRTLTSKCNSVTKDNECCCLALESCCCSWCALHGNREMIMLHYQLENTCCDQFLMLLACICSLLACITGMDELELISDILYTILMGCMTAQHEDEMQCKGYPRGTNIVKQSKHGPQAMAMQ
ncbi:hypothetical protein DIPPA_17053 [Diplonema papillatum]|nr:hypothetical protein DIPPA_17053 [Diplonema papillatum]